MYKRLKLGEVTELKKINEHSIPIGVAALCVLWAAFSSGLCAWNGKL